MIGFSFKLMLLTYFMIESDSFLAPIPTALNRTPTFAKLNLLPSLNSFAVADGLSAATYINKPEISGSLSTLRTFFIVLTATVFGITALAYLTAAFLVPKAAEQLEQDTKKLRPGLWEEYEAKLNEGEKMVNRPDLLQELGNKMQPVIMQQYEKEAAHKFGETKSDGK